MSNPNPNSERTNKPAPRSTDFFGRELPHALGAEQALLGSMLLDEGAIGEAINALGDVASKAFWAQRHQIIYDAIVTLWKLRKPIDGEVLRDELERRGQWQAAGEFEGLSDLLGAVGSASRARDYAEIVRDRCLLRGLIGATHEVAEVAFESRQTAAEILDLAEKRIFDVTERRVTKGAQLLPELIQDVFRRIETLDGNILTGEATGFFELDEMTCGLQPAELIIIAGRPSMGKTAFGLNIAEHMALTEGKPVMFFSLEMSAQQVAERLLCSRARVDAQKLRRGRHNAQDMEMLHRAAAEAQEAPLLVDDTSSLSVLELRARARMAHRRRPLSAIFVDYLQLMTSPGSESRQNEVASISRGLKALAKELSLPVVAMAQLNRNPEDRSSNRPRMSDLRESGAIEQDADVIGLLHRDSYYKVGEDEQAGEDAEAELIIAKQRNGPVGTVKLHFNRRFTRFDNPQFGGGHNVKEAYAGGDMSFPG